MKLPIAPLSVVGFLLASPASALVNQDTATQADGDPSAAHEIVCRHYPPPTGSRIGARNICKTQSEWAVHDREARQTLERAQVNRCNPPLPGGEGGGAGCIIQ